MRKIIALFIALLMLTAFVSAYENATIEGTAATGKAGDTVQITFSIINNPGLTSCTSYICYDRGALKLKSFIPERYVESSTAYATSQGVDKYPYAVVIANIRDRKFDSKFYTLEFEILDSAENGDYPIYFFFRDKDCTDINNQLLSFDIVNGNIKVENDEGFKPAEKKEYTIVVPPDTWNKKEEPKDFINKVKDYSEDYYTDLDKNAWYYSEVVASYEIGLMDGKGDGIFDPDGTLKVSEAITLAVRLGERYAGNEGKLTSDSEKWYDPYVEYALEKGMIEEGYFEDYEKEISRADMAHIMAKALPEECFAAKNSFEELPDVSKDDIRFDSIIKLYRAGVVLGVNQNFDFLPEQNIKRSEVSAIINRIARPASRKAK